MDLSQNVFHAGSMEHIRYPIFEGVIVEFFDERLYLPPAEKPCPAEARVTGEAALSASIPTEIGNAWTMVGFSGVGGVQFETGGATNVSYAFYSEAEDVENGANVVVQTSGFPIVLLICYCL